MEFHLRHVSSARVLRGAARIVAILAAISAAPPVRGSAPALRILADVEVDPNASAIRDENGDVVAHYAPPIVDGSSVYAEAKGGAFTHLVTWETQSWGVRRWDWEGGSLAARWTFASDWKPVPFAEFGTNPYGAGPLWEPVFEPAAAGDFLFVPCARGAVCRVRKADGGLAERIDPFDGSADDHTFVAGPVAASPSGIYFNVLRLDPVHPWDSDAVGSWLVRVAPNGAVSKVSYAGLVPEAPAAGAPCETRFSPAQLPFPPSADAAPPTIPCGSQRAALNLTPAFSADGTVYMASRAHFNGSYGYLIAFGADLSFRWAASLRDHLHDGCDVAVPPSGSPGGCRAGAVTGVDPATNRPPAAVVDDSSSASPVATPEGGVLYGANSRYDFAQGHLLKFSGQGAFEAAYGFGWDTTPVVYLHDDTYSVVLKENRYDVGSYCNSQDFCPTPRAAFQPDDPDAYFITRLDPGLAVEWQYRSVNTKSCTRLPGGALQCVSDHPRGFEFCVNLVAIAADGTVYANSEDGNLYVISRDGKLRQSLFLGEAVGAAYTPVVLGSGGRVYTQNFGRMIVAGTAPPGCPPAPGTGDGRPPICTAPAPVPALVRRNGP
jgi:outer membrane protein assembly factor BamB